MNHFTLILIFFAYCSADVKAQNFRDIDRSPMDMAYFPDDFAHNRSGQEEPIIRVIYSRPQMSGRHIFGSLLHYGELWRTGANENTEIKFYRDVIIDGAKLSAGTYSLFSIPSDNEWIIIFNKDLDSWGAYNYQESSDVLRVRVPSIPLKDTVEYFSIRFVERAENKAVMQMGWDKTMVEVPFVF